MEEILSIIRECESKLFIIIKREIDKAIIRCKENNYDSIKTYIEIQKVINDLYDTIAKILGVSGVSEELVEKVGEYTEEYEKAGVNLFQEKAELLLTARTLDELLDEMKKLNAIMKELDSVESSYIYEGVVFNNNKNCDIMYLKKEGV